MSRNNLKLTILLFPVLLLLFFPSEVNGQEEIEHSLQPSAGIIRRFQFNSHYIEDRKVDIWLPEGYSSFKEYSVLYMHDGQMLYDNSSSWNKKSWQVDSTIQKLINEKQIDEVIVVGIWNSPDRLAEYFPQKAVPYIEEQQKNELLKYMPSGLLADNYLKFIVNELKPFVDQTFSTKKEKTHTFIAGSSMGGLISLYALCEYPDIFGGEACLSTHWIGTLENNGQIPDALNQYIQLALPSPGDHKIYFDHGTVGLDANYPAYQKIIDQTLKQKEYDESGTISIEFEGENHNEDYWAARFSYPLKFLLGK